MPAYPKKRSKRLRLACVLPVAALSLAQAAAAASPEPPLPRFASLRSAEVNLRTGPGKRYPVDWVFVRRDMPVEIIGSFDTWRKVRDYTGAQGWVHQSMLSGRRTAIITAGYQRMRKEPSRDSAVVATVQARVVGRLIRCDAKWCRLNISGVEGWLPRDSLWGVREGEKLK